MSSRRIKRLRKPIPLDPAVPRNHLELQEIGEKQDPKNALFNPSSCSRRLLDVLCCTNGKCKAQFRAPRKARWSSPSMDEAKPRTRRRDPAREDWPRAK
jgi:hypothetical protein